MNLSSEKAKATFTVLTTKEIYEPIKSDTDKTKLQTSCTENSCFVSLDLIGKPEKIHFNVVKMVKGQNVEYYVKSEKNHSVDWKDSFETQGYTPVSYKYTFVYDLVSDGEPPVINSISGPYKADKGSNGSYSCKVEEGVLSTLIYNEYMCYVINVEDNSNAVIKVNGEVVKFTKSTKMEYLGNVKEGNNISLFFTHPEEKSMSVLDNVDISESSMKGLFEDLSGNKSEEPTSFANKKFTLVPNKFDDVRTIISGSYLKVGKQAELSVEFNRNVSSYTLLEGSGISCSISGKKVVCVSSKITSSDKEGERTYKIKVKATDEYGLESEVVEVSHKATVDITAPEIKERKDLNVGYQYGIYEVEVSYIIEVEEQYLNSVSPSLIVASVGSNGASCVVKGLSKRAGNNNLYEITLKECGGTGTVVLKFKYGTFKDKANNYSAEKDITTNILIDNSSFGGDGDVSIEWFVDEDETKTPNYKGEAQGAEAINIERTVVLSFDTEVGLVNVSRIKIDNEEMSIVKVEKLSGSELNYLKITVVGIELKEDETIRITLEEGAILDIKGKKLRLR